ncbi:MAG: hypothetical protein WC341_17930, partial [Bacteroidales bacterium]
MSSSNTAKNSTKNKVPGRPFEKDDPRINRNGRPRHFDAARAIAQAIADENAKKKDPITGKVAPYKIDDREISTIEAILRNW